ncbi:hypothetical protein EST38_g3992 [Candolleomyces aberdarensis]|uniref:Uncharacterized protein n=1 Tax=Candolleomyces aberdarensis TaxID=2316362 RepID=A0A4Q2DSH6_9AGAR|nr:hypothetical protein EST38_g3992 [Candolleomyces aberdarensis]
MDQVRVSSGRWTELGSVVHRYSLMDSMRDRRVRVWFRHYLAEHTSTYIINNCSKKFKAEIQDKVKSLIASEDPLGDLMFIDHIIINEVIAELTSKISEQTQKDSSAMITIAALTLVFLPATFISSIFSMSFFDFQDSNKSVSIANNIWLYPAVAIPFTIIVIFAWNWWAKHGKSSNNRVKAIDERYIGSDESLTSAGHWWNCDSDKEVRATNVSLGGQILPVVREDPARGSRSRLTSNTTELKSEM